VADVYDRICLALCKDSSSSLNQEVLHALIALQEQQQMFFGKMKAANVMAVDHVDHTIRNSNEQIPVRSRRSFP
jgi:hypothetical protein